MVDIHKRCGLAFPAIGRDVSAAGFRRDHQGRGRFAHRTPHPSACCHHHTTLFTFLQCPFLHFYHPSPIIKSGFKPKNY